MTLARPSGPGPVPQGRDVAVTAMPTLQRSETGDLAELVGEITQLEASVAGWDDSQRSTVAAYKRAIEALHAEALRRVVRACKSEPAALAALRAAAADEVVYAVMRQLGVVKPSLDERLEAALDSVRPMLGSHGGNVELVRVEPPVIEVRLLGACDGCVSSAMTLHAGVKQAVLDACPEITGVVQVRGACAGHRDVDSHASPFALAKFGTWRYACELAEIPDGGIRALAIGGRDLLLARRAGTVACFDNICAHLGARLDHGQVEAGVLTCRDHGFAYDLVTGECLTVPNVALAKHLVRVIGTRIELKLPR